MRRIYLLPLTILLVISVNTFAQNQDAFNYQAAIRDNEGNLLENHDLKILFEILEDDANSNAIYSEMHSTKTNAFGLVALEIGNGNPILGEMNTINWASSPKYIRVSIDLDQNGEYKGVSTSQLLSVPYALYAKYSSDSYWKNNNSSINYTGGNTGIGTATPHKLLDISIPSTGNEKNNGLSVNRNAGHLDLINGTLYDGHFQARISAKSTHEDSPGLVIAATPFADEINKQGILLRAGENEALQNANALTVQNYDQTLMTIKPDGKVGIGTENPNYQLDVNGGVNATIFYQNGEPVELSQWSGNQNDIFFNSGNIGIGTNTPTNLLNIELPENGNQKNKGLSVNRSTGHLDLINGTIYDGHFQARISAKSTHEDSPGLVIAATPFADEINKHGILLRAGENEALQNANALTVQNYDQTLMTVKPDGNVGIGTENPNYQLDVNGGVNATILYQNGEPVELSQWSGNQNDIFFNSGNIGIGTNTPTNLLNIELPENGNQKNKGLSVNRNAGHLDLINGTIYDGHFQARISAKSTHEDSPGLVIAATPFADEINKHGILLRAGENEALQNANALTVQNYEQTLMTVKPDGNVGIGTTSPKAKLQVTNGDIYIEDASSGVIMTSPNGNCWRMTVDNTGVPQFTSITCPE